MQHTSQIEIVGGRFRAVERLKRGAEIETWRAHDEQTGQQAVVKAAPVEGVSLAARMRLEHEASVLTSLVSPHLGSVLAVGEDAGWLYLAMPWVPGVTLADRLARDGALPLLDALRVGIGVAAGLDDAHRHGVLHRDVKPSNIVVDDEGPVQRVVLIDFGLARSAQLHAGLAGQPVGTARYVSPEQAGLLDVDVDARADLYSLGAVLFECVSGRPLFDGGTVREVLRQQLTLPTPRTDAPRAVSEVIQRLLRKDPRDRYHTAAAVLHDLVEIERALQAGEAEPAVVVGSRDTRPTLTEPGFVGRRRELALLDRHHEAASRGEGRLVLVEGESGGGKSRLLEEASLRRRRSGDLVLEGRGADQAADRPFEVLTGVVAGVVDACGQDPAVAERVRSELPDHAAALVSAFPELTPVLGAEGDGQLGPEEYGEIRTILALVALFDVLGTPARPATVILDDCQWADDATLRVIEHWHRTRRAPRWTGLAVAYRSEEVTAEHLLRRLPGARRVVLGPLGAGEVRQLAESMAGELPDGALQLVLEVGGGSPFMASAALRGLTESRTLWRDEDGWHLDADRLDEAGSSREAGVFLSRRLDLLPEGVRSLLQVAAVLGKDFDPGLAAELAGQQGATAVASIDEARRRHLIWMGATGSRCTFVHDKVREALLAGMDDGERRRLHHRAAVWTETHQPDAVFELAHHFDAAGLPERGLPHALAAADRSRAQHALELSERSYRMAARGVGEDDTVTRRRIAEGLGDVLMLRGHYTDAGEQLELAAALAGGPTDRAQVIAKLGELAFKRGDMQTSRTHLERALRLLGRRVPRRRLAVLAFLAFEVVVQILHSALPRLFVGRRDPTRADTDLMAARIYSPLAYTYWFSQGRAACAWSHLREMNLTERYPPTAERAQAYSEHAPVMTMLPWHSRGIAYAERSLAIRRELQDVWGQGQSLHFHGVALYAASRYEECLARCREAVRLLERTGDRWEVNTARWHIAFCRYRLGDPDAAVETARQVYQEARELGDDQAAAIAAGVWAKATDGDVPDDLLRGVLAARRDDVHATAEALQARALALLRAGRPQEAGAALEDAWRQVRKAGLRQEYVAPVLPWLATARRVAAEGTPALDPRLHRRRVRRLRRTARRAVRLARRYRNNLPHALREQALGDALAGRPRAARRRLDRAVAVAEAQGARRELARCLLARADVGDVHGWDGAADDRLAARTLPGGSAAHDAGRVTLSILERFEAIVEEGRRIAGTLTRPAVLEATQRATVRLLRAERCEVVLLTSGEDGVTLDSSGGNISRSLVEAAVARGAPVVATRGGFDGDPTDSMVLTSSRSALAAPIAVRGEPRACMYATHDGVEGLFGEEEEGLAAFVCTLAGAALENAEGFAEIERRVAERTAELATTNRELDASLAQLREALAREQEVTERLRQLDEMKNEFVAMVAHDLRAPMVAVAGAADLLSEQEGSLDAATRGELLAMISRSVKRLANMVEDVLQVARLESGALRYELVPFDLVAVAGRLVEEQRAAGETRLRLRVDDGEPPLAFGDADRYWQVLSNLIGNACTYSAPDAPVEVVIRPAGAELVVSVTDRGPGIAADDIPLLFQKFSRLQASADEPKGTGLGLYICKSIVEAQGGRVWVDSEVGRGSTFSFSVPAHRG